MTQVLRTSLRKVEVRSLVRIIHARSIALPIRGDNRLSANGLVRVNTRGVFHSFWGENTEMKNTAVAKKTIAGPEGISNEADIRTPATAVVMPMMME